MTKTSRGGGGGGGKFHEREMPYQNHSTSERSKSSMHVLEKVMHISTQIGKNQLATNSLFG